MSDDEPQQQPVDRGVNRRLRSFYERASSSATQKYKEAEEARERSRTAGVAFDLRDRDLTVNGRLLAGAIAFQAFLFLVPVMAALAALGLLHTGPGQWKGGLGLFSREMTSTIDASLTSRIVTFVVSLFAGAWAGFGLLRSFRAVYAMVWNVSPGKLRLRGSLVAAFLGAFAIIVSSQVVCGRLLSGMEGSIILIPLVSLGSSAGAWILLSTFLPRRAGTTWRDLLPGAAVFGVGMGALQLFTRIYETGRLTRATGRYGSLGLAVVMLAWLYFGARLVVLAPEVAATLDERRRAGDGTGS
jgi:membrane protein